MKQSLLKLRLFIVSLCLCSGLPALHATADATEPNGGGYFSELEEDTYIPYSDSQMVAIQKLAEANPNSSDLQDFVVNKLFMEDRPYSDEYNVGVVWNNENPREVQQLFIRDYDKTVSTLDLSAFTGLEHLILNGTNVSSLDLDKNTKLYSLELWQTQIQKWTGLILPHNDVIIHGASIIPYPEPDREGGLDATIPVGTTVDLSQWANAFNTATEFAWIRNNRDTVYFDNNGTPGMFDFPAYTENTYQCIMTNASRPGLELKTSIIRMKAEEPVKEMKLISSVPDLDFGRYDTSNKGYYGSYYQVANCNTLPYVYIRITGGTTPNVKLYNYNSHNSEQMELDTQNGVWYPVEFGYYKEGKGFADLSINFEASSIGSFTYEVSVYASQDLSSTPLLSSGTKQVNVINSNSFPQLKTPSLSIRGDKNKDHTFTCQLQAGSEFSQFAGQLRFYLTGADAEGISISGEGLTHNERDNLYYWDIPSIGNGTYTFTINSSVDYSSEFQLYLYRIEGNNYYSSASTSTFSIQIPPSFSKSDQDALKALATANPKSNDLYNFIQQGIYLKDTEKGQSSQNVGVTWNAETPARVKSFFIKDWESRAVTSLDLNALTALEEVNINGTNLTHLDLSELTLTKLYLSDTKLTWTDVTLPNWNENWHHLDGWTQIQAGTPLDDYNSVAASGTVIDLSKYAMINGVASTYQWYDQDHQTVSMPTTETAGSFILQGQPGEKYRCEISNDNYGYWRLGTSTIRILRNSADYNETDINGLKKLAADNPDVDKLQEFIASKGWEANNWDSWQDKIRTDWNSEGRLTHLHIELDWNSQDTISTLDLSAFTELKYFACERFMNITKLDLSQNTNLEHLHVFSYNLSSIDVSMCPNLKVLKFATESIGEWWKEAYERCQLSSLNVSGCTQLQTLKLEHAHLTSFDFSQVPNLEVLRVDNCRDLEPINLGTLQYLTTVEIPYTTKFWDWLNNDLKSSVRELLLNNTDYPALHSYIYNQLTRFGVPSNTQSLDMNEFPNIQIVDVDGSQIRYSTVSNRRSGISYGGNTYLDLFSPSHPERPDLFENGDTIDLSSEAVINGVNSKFLWVNTKYDTEELEAFQEVEGHPGVFVINSKEEKYGSYRCLIMNEQFCEITPINQRRGWRMQTNWFQVNTEVPVTYHEGDVQALSQIVKNSDNQQLLNWWNEDCWQTDKNIYNAQALWSDGNPRRLKALYIYNNKLGSHVDLSALDSLEIVSLTNYDPFSCNILQSVTLPTQTENLRSVMVGGNRKLASLIVSPYSNLEYLDISNTGLTACDVSQNGKLQELMMTNTAVQSVEETAPAIAQQLVTYGVPKGVINLDMDNFPNLTKLIPHNTMRFAYIHNARQMNALESYEEVKTEYYVTNSKNHFAYSITGDQVDITTDAEVNGVVSTYEWLRIPAMTEEATRLDCTEPIFTLTDELDPEDQIKASITNELFPGWTVEISTFVYTMDGDINMDRTVNVQDVTGMVRFMLNEWEDGVLFGWAQSDVNYDGNRDASDLIGIVNLILERPITKASALRAGEYVPSVALEVDEKNFLTMENEKPVAGLYLEFTGATEQLPLLGDAARLSQASSLHGDTLRIVAYSMDGKSIASGKHILMQIQPGMKLIKANFSDKQAVTLRNSGSGAPTANEIIRPSVEAKAISNYPNPTSGQTTFTYTLEEAVEQAEIQIFASNGALAARLQGMPTAVGMNSQTAHLSLPIGVYYYRLLLNGKQATATNILIIK
ncbi:MAG: flagellar biosynthesis protein FlgD [Parabacteroides sp.]|nr:flagellar biosynthesis protein FlgD [bacterium]MDY4102693.1 flagellar biosynthesis protein FlgD [Parabacteroides sp.]